MSDHEPLSDDSRRMVSPDAGFTVLVGEEAVDGKFSFLEFVVDPGAETAPHWHQETVEVFYVLEGSLTVIIDDDEHVLTAGDSLLVPPRTIHALANTGDESCRHLLLFSPGEFEGFFRESAEIYAQADSWPPKDVGPVEEVFHRYDNHEPPIERSGQE